MEAMILEILVTKYKDIFQNICRELNMQTHKEYSVEEVQDLYQYFKLTQYPIYKEIQENIK